MTNKDFIVRFAQFAAPEKGQKFGIENLKGFVAYVADVVDSFADALNDGRISFVEALGLTPAIIKGTRLMANLPLIVKELVDLDEAEKDELIKQLGQLDYFKQSNRAVILNRINAAAAIVLDAVQMVEAAQRFVSGAPKYDNNGFLA